MTQHHKQTIPIDTKTYPLSRWLCWLFLAASILLFCYTYYRAEIIHHGEYGAKFLKYYVIALAGICFWSVALRLRAALRVNIVTVALSVLVGLYLVESGLLLFTTGKRAAAATMAKHLGIEIDQRTRVQVIDDLRRDGVDAIPTVFSLLSQEITKNESLMSFGSIANKTTVMTNEGGQYAIYLSDRYGFNNPDSVWDQPEPAWLLSGDSFTQGVAVQAGEDIAGQIRTITNELVISLGMVGNGPLIELAVLKEYAEMMRPKKVLWVYYEGNDLTEDLPQERHVQLLMNYLHADFSQQLIQRQEEIDHHLKAVISKWRESWDKQSRKGKFRMEKVRMREFRQWIAFHNIRQLIDKASYEGHEGVEFDIDPLFAKILASAKARVEGWGGQFYFVYLPEFARYVDTSIDHGLHKKRAEVIALVKGLNISVIDMHNAVFAVHPDPLALFPLRRHGHYTAEGYRAVAQAIVNAIPITGYDNK